MLRVHVKLLPIVLNSIALRKAKIACNFGLSECNRVKYNDKYIVSFPNKVNSKLHILHVIWHDTLFYFDKYIGSLPNIMISKLHI